MVYSFRKQNFRTSLPLTHLCSRPFLPTSSCIVEAISRYYPPKASTIMLRCTLYPGHCWYNFQSKEGLLQGLLFTLHLSVVVQEQLVSSTITCLLSLWLTIQLYLISPLHAPVLEIKLREPKRFFTKGPPSHLLCLLFKLRHQFYNRVFITI